MVIFKETVRSFANYFIELKELKEAGIDLSKLDVHVMLYQMCVENLFKEYGFREATLMLKYAADNKVSDRDLEILYNLIYPEGEPDALYSEESEPETTSSGKECTVPETEEVKPVFTSKFYVNGEEVTEDEYKKALKEHNENVYRHNHFIGDDWFMRNIFGF